jgi:hypothetical protein
VLRNLSDVSPQESMIKMESWGMINEKVINLPVENEMIIVNVNEKVINVPVKNESVNDA